MTTVARTVMNRLVGDYSFDEVIGAKRSDIAVEARQDIQRILDAYVCGLTVTALQMQRVIPPERVKPAFDKVNASIQEKQKLENEAESTRNKLTTRGQGQPRQLIREAEGYASRRRAESRARSRRSWRSTTPTSAPLRSPASGSTSRRCRTCSRG